MTKDRFYCVMQWVRQCFGNQSRDPGDCLSKKQFFVCISHGEDNSKNYKNVAVEVVATKELLVFKSRSRAFTSPFSR